MNRLSLLFLVTAALVAGCGDDAPPLPTPHDGGMDGMTREGGTDARPPGDGDVADGDQTDALHCYVSIDCPEGWICRDHACVPPEIDCCSGGVCPGATFCDFSTCMCTGGCDPACGPGEFCYCDFGCRCEAPSCCTGLPCAVGDICDWDSCSCTPDICDPPCPGDFVCSFGECYPRCFFDPCPDPSHVCSETMGCIPPQCTAGECALMEPPQACDETAGCFDPCLPESDWFWCTSMGGRCVLGSCVDDSCGSISGLPVRGCSYRTDCCGNSVCLHDDEPEPFCPAPRCAPEEPPVRPDLCTCGLGGTCADLRYGGVIIFPTPPPRPPP